MNKFKLEKKYLLFFITISCCFLFLKKIYAQCPANCTTGCNIIITANPDAGTYNPTAGQVVCIQSGANFTGTINIPAGSAVSVNNCGTMAGIIVWGSAASTLTANNSGTWSFTLNGAHIFTFTNCSGATFTGAAIQPGNGSVFDNYGSATTNINYGTGNASNQFNNRSGGTLTLTAQMNFSKGTFTNYSGATFSNGTNNMNITGGAFTNSAASMTIAGITLQNTTTFTNNVACTINMLGMVGNNIANSGLSLAGGGTVLLYNYGTISMTGTNLTGGGTNTRISISGVNNILYNYGVIDASNDYYTYYQTTGTFNNYGTMNIYNFQMDGSVATSLMYNECLLNVRNNYTQNGTNATTVTGPTNAGEYGELRVGATSTLTTPSIYGSAAGQHLDICDAGTPAGGWDSKTGTEGAGVTYCVNSASGTTGGYCNAALVLPIHLLWFNASQEEQTVLTTWQTMSETNNDYFTIEKSVDGKNFMGAGKIKGAGNSTEPIVYKFTDDAPFPGRSYYRLKQTDYDGKFDYSRLVSVNMGNTHDELMLTYFFQDQNTNTLSYQIFYSGKKELSAQVINTLGESVISQPLGNADDLKTFTINTSGLSHGIYILKISDGVNVTLKKFFY